MLELLRGRSSHGHPGHSSPRRSGPGEPAIAQIVTPPAIEQSNPHDVLSQLRSPGPSQQQQAALLSPTLSTANVLSVNKRQSSVRPMGSVRASYGRFSNAFVREQHELARHKCQIEFGASVDEHAFNTSFPALLEWIRAERMISFAQKGGTWDRVLIAAQYFAEQVHHFSRHIETFTEDSGTATNFVFGQCRVLLELGHTNAAALEKAFDLFYQFGLELSPLIARADLFLESQVIMEGVSRAFADLLQIVAGTSITFFQAVHSGRASTRIDIFSSFSVWIDTFRLRVHRCSQEMWNVALAIRNKDGCEVDVLQKWLAPKDSVLAFLSSNHINLACRPEQFTCRWFQSDLIGFVKSGEKYLLVEGKPGTGKTTLATWTVNRLQRRIAGRHISTISFLFDPSVAAQSTPLVLLRTLLHQLLTIRIGNLRLFEAINEAYIECQKLKAVEQEAVMWEALSKALQAVSSEPEDSLAIVIDSVVESDATIQQACKKLYELTQKYAGARLIQFCQNVGGKQATPGSIRIVRLPQENTDDIRTLVRRKLHAFNHFKDREVGEQEEIIERIATIANGNMLWTYLACKLLQQQSSHKGFTDTLKTLTSNESVSVSDVVAKLYTSLNLQEDHKTLLSILLVAMRPLRMVEMEALLNTREKSVDVRSTLSRLSSLVIMTEGLVAIRHDAVRQAITKLTGDSFLTQRLNVGHEDMLIRLFESTKSSLKAEQEPTLTLLEVVQAESRLHSHPLLEYTIRYWTMHFKKSPLFKEKGDLQLPKEFKNIFPPSVILCLLEQSCWSEQYFTQQALEMHLIAYRVRKTIFGQNHACVLQSALYCATIYELISRPSEAIEWYALVARIGSTVIGVQADITIHCCSVLLRLTETSISKTRTTIMIYREEILLILVSSYKHRYGSSSKEVLEIYKRLQELYVVLEEETKIAEIVAIIQKLTIGIFGSHSHEAQLISRDAEVLLKHHDKPVIDVVDGPIFEGYIDEREEFTLRWIQVQIELVLEFISRREFTRAEELYIELWLKLSEHCHIHHVCEWHEKKIEIMLMYAEFLLTQKRSSEASAILVTIWTEYEHHEFSMTRSIIVLLKKVAVCLREVKLLTVALLVFNKCYWYFKNRHEESEAIFVEISKYISLTSTEIHKESTSISVEKSSETVIREIFESSLTSTETITFTTVELCQSLVTIYEQEERWSEAISCVKKMLLRSWSTFFSESFESIQLAESFSSESITLVRKLIQSYISMRRYSAAEEIYFRLYHCHRNHLKIDNVIVIGYKQDLLEFYAKYEMFTKAISFYQELLVEYRAHFGASHDWTIDILYALGALCRQHSVNYGYWLEYYLEIVVSLNKNSLVCHDRAFKALLIIAEHYYETLRYSESLVYYKLIFATFYKRREDKKFFQELFIDMRILIEHYLRSIEESKVELSVHIQILKELREACHQFYGESHEVTLSVTVALAETYCKSEEYQFEAISFYESIVKHQTVVSREIVRRSQTSLKTLYVKQITSSSTTVTKETIEKATILILDLYKEVRRDYSYSHTLTLSYLRELLLLYHKQEKTELALEELRTVIIGCIVKVTSAKELVEAATFLAETYRSYEFTQRGIEIIRELKLQIIYKSIRKEFGFDVTKVDRSCFAFIAAFEYHLRADYSRSLTLYMSDLVAEYLFYERLTVYIKKEAQLNSVFVCGARLYQILLRTHRKQDFFIIQQQVLQFFMKHETDIMKHSDVTESSARIFVHVVLEHLFKYSALKSWTTAIGHAALDHLKYLLKHQMFKEALDLTRCTFRFLMAHEGLDDPTEITLGFQLCLLMAGRSDDKSLNQKCNDPAIHKAMIDLSRKILGEVFDICSKMEGFSFARCQISELNALIILIGEQQDYGRLEWLLELLWKSREGQTTWSTETVLKLGKRLVQAQFVRNHTTSAIRLCENIVYNVRRVHGVRHYYTVSFQDLLASMYITLAFRYINEAGSGEKGNKKHAEDMARSYCRKAVQVHEDVLKQIVNADDADASDDDDEDEYYNDTASTQRGLTNGDHNALDWLSRDQEIQAAQAHVRRLQLALQRHGGFVKPIKNYENLTSRVWSSYGKEPGFKMSQDQVLASKWKVNDFGSGKAEAGIEEDGFHHPQDWRISGQV